MFLLAAALGSSAGTSEAARDASAPQAAELRRLYSLPPARWPKAWIDAAVEARELAPLPPMTYPARNPVSTPKIQLGRLLFFDPRLSRSGQIACASCHEPRLGWSDGRRLAIGFAHSEGVMNSPSIANAGYEQALFWDGRASSLETQIPGSLSNPVEMNTSVPQATAAIASIPAYRRWVAAAYGDTRVNWTRLCDAIATYVRSIQLRDTAYDRFLRATARLSRTRRCAACICSARVRVV